jgi:LuxR family maltose regulon positive regulatory protein
LANRLDVIERTSAPEAVAHAYLTLARVAFDRRELERVQDLLEGLYSLGVQRRQPRMIVASLAEQVRVQASLDRREGCALAVKRLREQRESWREAERGVGAIVDLMCGLAQIRAALCARDEPAASAAIEQLHQSGVPGAGPRDRLELLFLQWRTMRLRNEPADEVRRELEDTAAANGMFRLLREVHARVEAPGRTESEQPLAQGEGAVHGAAVADATPSGVLHGALLTAKEREILALLVRNYSNKEIARALDVGPATVKWHLANLFGKLNVGGRRHAVQRARMLQLIALDEMPH